MNSHSRVHLVIPRLTDPRVTLATALTLYTVLGQSVFYFNRDPREIVAATAVACGADMLLAFALHRQLLLPPLSAYITGLSLGLLLESFALKVFVAASAWAVASKYLLRDRERHFFNPSNFGVVAAIVLSHGTAMVAPGSQWGADPRLAVFVLAVGLMMNRRVNRLDLALAWIGGYLAMGCLRMLVGQGGLVFVLGPMTGAEFALFTFSMMPDPKTSPPTRRGRIVWGLLIAVVDGVLRLLEIRYSMFFALFALCALLPLFRAAASAAGVKEPDPWRVLDRALGSGAARS
jgi:Na+-transporting NADH:ubiquinone oxidoreductase subunit NqrB